MKFALTPRRRETHGFTLIELMVTVAIVAILAAIAVPSYRYAVLKGRRAQARTAILEVMQQQERYMTQNNRYAIFDSTSLVFKTYSGDNSNNSPYAITAKTCPNPNGGTDLDIKECVQVVATLRTGFVDDAAGNLNMTSTGVKACSSGATALCWP